jgi:hypothetical protein
MLGVLTDRQLDYTVAEQIFGWRWLTYHGVPVRGTPGYPEQCAVREFFPPHAKGFDEMQLATMSEPLSYAYGSSVPPHYVPNYSGSYDSAHCVEVVMHKAGLWNQYRDALYERLHVKPEDQLKTHLLAKFHLAHPADRCEAALAALRAVEQANAKEST